MTASIGSSATICATTELACSAWPVLTGTSLTTPEIGARTWPRSHSALAAASAASAARRSASQLVLLVGRHDAALDQLHVDLEVGLALQHHGLRLGDLRLARLVRQDGDHVALLHDRAAAHLQLDDRAVGARHGARAVVGLGAAGQHDRARMALRRGRR